MEFSPLFKATSGIFTRTGSVRPRGERIIGKLSAALSFSLFQTPAAGGSGYSFNFTSASRCNDLLGFNKLVYLAVNDVIVGSKPFHLTRTLQIVMHTDIQPAFPQCTLDNYGQSLTPFDNSDILAVIPVDQPPRGRINYQTTEKINVCGSSLRSSGPSEYSSSTTATFLWISHSANGQPF
jgi:hypothetical protein